MPTYAVDRLLLGLDDSDHVVLPRYTQPDKDQQIILQQLKMTLPDQPAPRLALEPNRPDAPAHAV